MSRFHTSALAVSLLAPATLVALACTEGPLETAAVRDAPRAELAVAAVRPMTMTATVELVSPVVPPPAPCLALLNSVIEGTATHLGKFAGVGSTCILNQIAPDPNPPFLPPGPPPYATAPFSNPLWTLTASNGDELWIESIEGVAVISLTDGSLRAEGRQRIIGGTGRFAGATGEVQAHAINEDGQGPDDFQSDGWIRFRASDRADH